MAPFVCSRRGLSFSFIVRHVWTWCATSQSFLLSLGLKYWSKSCCILYKYLHLVNSSNLYPIIFSIMKQIKQFIFIVLAAISAGIYFLFLCYMIWKVFMNISSKRAALPSMSSVRRLHYEGVIYRFKFLMMATLLCASLTVIGFILGQVYTLFYFFTKT